MSMSESDLDRLLKSNPALKVAGVGKPTASKPVFMPPQDNAKAVAGKCGTKSGGPNKTELEYSRMLACEFPGADIVFEGLKIKLACGMVYTPDWIVKRKEGLLCVEVKHGGYKFPSYGRSKMAFSYAKIEWPQFEFRWSNKTKDGWEIA